MKCVISRRLRYVNRGYYDKEIYVICDKSNEADLWKCTATISFNSFVPRTCTVSTLFVHFKNILKCICNVTFFLQHTFSRWKQEQYIYTDRKVRVGSFLEVTITTNDDGDRYALNIIRAGSASIGRTIGTSITLFLK